MPTLIAKNTRYAGKAINTASTITAAIAKPAVPFTWMDMRGSMGQQEKL
jgi:hypothetical protein